MIANINQSIMTFTGDIEGKNISIGPNAKIFDQIKEKAQALAVKMYEQAAAAQQAPQGAEGAQSADSSNNNGDDVVDGEFTEK